MNSGKFLENFVKFIINSDNAEFTNTQPNLIYMKQVYCRFFFKDGTILEIISDKGLYDNITNDMEFENNVKMFYLENKIFAEKDEFIKLALVGLISLLIIQTFIHIGVNIRLLPTTGMTLPFLSYGGSSLIGSSIVAGIILNFTRKNTSRYFENE